VKGVIGTWTCRAEWWVVLCVAALVSC